MVSGNSTDVIYKEVVIIGNGPSGISLSYILSGNLPYVTSDSHPDEMLSRRLAPTVGQCLIKQDLGHLAAGLEGRSTNPVSLLLDNLLHPYADIGLEMEPLVEFRPTGIAIDHVVLGKGPPGGSWHKMDPYILTLSLGSWMALPGLPYSGRDSGEKRAFACNIANYYVQYVKKMNLFDNFINNVTVNNIKPLNQKFDRHRSISEPMDHQIITSNHSLHDTLIEFDETTNLERKECTLRNAVNFILSRGHRKSKPNRCCKRAREALCWGQTPNNRKISQVRERTKSVSCDSSLDNNVSNSTSRVPFRISSTYDPDKKGNWLVECCNVESGEVTIYECKYLVLANGSSDLPNRLDFSRSKIDPNWLFHDLRSLENHLDQYLRQKNDNDEIDPVLIVGAGLSAADAVIATRGRNVPVLHVFRSKSADFSRQLPENMYPEYHKVHQMMQDGGSTYPYYSAYPEYNLTDIDEINHSVVLTSKDGNRLKLQVSFAAVLIGARPDLTFLPQETHLGRRKDLPVDCKTNTLDINKLTHEVEDCQNLFAVGPLAGDNFVRFIPGGAMAVVSELYKRYNYINYV